MQRATLDYRSIVVGNDAVFTESYNVESESHGTYHFLIGIRGGEDVGFADLGYALNQSFKEVFLEKEGDLFEVFEACVTKVNEQFLQLEAEMDLKDVLIDAVIFAERNSEVMLTRCGLAEVYMIRDEGFVDLSESIDVDKSSKELFDNVISGKVEKSDYFLIGNQRLLRFVGETVLVRKSLSLDLDEFIKFLGDEIEKSGPEKIMGMVIECKDVVFYKEKVVDKDSVFVKFGKNFRRAFLTVVRSVLSGNVKSIDVDLRKKIIFFFVVLIGIFMVSTLGLAYRSVVKSEEARFRDELQTAQLIVNNAQSEFDKEVVGKMLQNAEAKLNSIRGLESLEGDIQDVYQQIKDIRVKIDNVVWVEAPKLEMKIFGKGQIGDSLLSVLGYDSLIYVASNYDLIEIVSGVKKAPISFEVENNEINKIVWDKEGKSMYLLTKDRNVKKVQSGLVSLLNVDDDSLGYVSAGEFYSDKLYLLDTENQQIWSHQVRRSGLGTAKPYLKDGYGKFVGQAVDIAIDGYVYVLTDSGDIFRFLRGEMDDRFKVAEKPMIPLLNPDSMFTELDVPFLFVLESDQNRIVQYYKDTKSSRLEYVQQYIFPELDGIRDMSIDYQSKKIYVIDDGAIYSTNLKEI